MRDFCGHKSLPRLICVDLCPDSPSGLNLCSRQDVPRSLLLQGVMVHGGHMAALSFCSNAFHGSHLPHCLPDPLSVLGRCLGLSSLTSLRPVSPVFPRNPGSFLHWLHVLSYGLACVPSSLVFWPSRAGPACLLGI